MNAGRTKQDSCLPGIEFEGPLAFFWCLDEVPIESIAMGLVELMTEGQRRGFNLDILMKIGKETQKRLEKKP